MSNSLEHWQTLNRRHDLSGVGQSGLPPEMNRWLYRAQQRRARCILDGLGLRPSTVYDVGAGTGYWTSFWRRRGARVSGCDLTPEAVGALGGGFEVLDISRERPTGVHELVWVANVLLHVLDEDRFVVALGNIAAAVQPGGYLVLIEPLQIAAYRPIAGDRHSTARPASAYLEPLRAAGLTEIGMWPATALTSDPIEASSKLHYRGWRAIWRALKAPARVVPWTGRVMGFAAYGLDPLVLRLAGGVTSKLVVMHRPNPS